MTDTVFIVSKTPQQRLEPSPSFAFYDEDLANKAARAWESKGWNVSVDKISIKEELSPSTISMLKNE